MQFKIKLNCFWLQLIDRVYQPSNSCLYILPINYNLAAANLTTPDTEIKLKYELPFKFEGLIGIVYVIYIYNFRVVAVMEIETLRFEICANRV